MDSSAVRVVGLVPARGGSKGVPRKNARPLAGRPLLAWTAAAALAARSLDRVVLSTEDDELADIGRRHGLDVPFRREAALAADDTPMIDVIVDALDRLADAGDRYDAVCLLQPTNPARTADDIDATVERFVASGADTAFTTLAIPAEHHPDWAYVVDPTGRLLTATDGEPVARRQDLRPAVHREGSVYVSRTSVVRERRSLYGSVVVGHPIDPSRSVNIDTPADWERAERLLGGTS